MNNLTALQEEHVPVKSRVWISIADSGTAILQSLVAFSALTYYFVKLRGLDTGLAGTVWLIFGIWNAFNDPLLGYISDRTRSAIGRRLPYIRYGAPFLALAFILLWLYIPGSDGNQTLLFIQMLVALFLYDTLYTSIATNIYIMPYEMAVSNKARSTIYIWKIIFMVFTLVVPMALERFKPDVGDVAGISSFRWLMVGFGIGMAALVFVSTFFYREKHFTQEQKQPPFFTAIKECFTNRAFVVFETISFTIIFAQTAIMQGIWLYFDELKVPGLPLYVALAVGIVAGVVLWINRRDKWGVKTSTRLMALIFAVGCFVLLVGGRSVIPSAIGFLCFGFGFAGGMYLIPLMNGDVVDYDEHKTGLRREGMYAGINSLITKPAISIAQWALLTIIAAYGYDQTLAKGTQSASAQTGILVGWLAPTGVLLLICFFTLALYPLAGKAWEEIKKKLALVHREKEKKYLEAHGYKFVE
ncbi:MAG TPA: MFS transporter [Anaerolineales bacterium]|nr:MFS transporter [Anaerolineales bacterium]